jgi:aryl-alcohol dehydrogenase-like predicted oxidoreductase
MSIPTRKIGQAHVSEIGFGAMGISTFYGAVESDEDRFKVSLSALRPAKA